MALSKYLDPKIEKQIQSSTVFLRILQVYYTHLTRRMLLWFVYKNL